MLPSHYEGYGLPAVEALTQGCATIVSDAGSLPEVTAGHAAIFPGARRRGAVRDPRPALPRPGLPCRAQGHGAELPAESPGARPAPQRRRRRSTTSRSGASHDFDAAAAPVGLSLDATLKFSIFRCNRCASISPSSTASSCSPSRKRRAAIEAVARRHFAEAVDSHRRRIAGAESLPADHQAAQHLAPQAPLSASRDRAELSRGRRGLSRAPTARPRRTSRTAAVHTGYYFLEDMGGWLAGSPTADKLRSRHPQRLAFAREAAYPTRGYASHMPQIVNKSLVNEIYDRFVPAPDAPRSTNGRSISTSPRSSTRDISTAKPYETLGWPMRTGDWFPEIAPADPAFENYYPQNYDARRSVRRARPPWRSRRKDRPHAPGHSPTPRVSSRRAAASMRLRPSP